MNTDMAQTSGDALLRRLEALEAEVGRLRDRIGTLEAAEDYKELVAQRDNGSGPGRLSRSAHLAALDFIDVGSGFHHLEYGEADIAYRWTGPESAARVAFWVDRTRPLLIRIKVASLGGATSGAPVAVEVDDEEHIAAYDLSTKVLQVGPVRPRGHPGPTMVVIHAPVMRRLNDAGGTDNRLVGLAINRIDLTPA